MRPFVHKCMLGTGSNGQAIYGISLSTPFLYRVWLLGLFSIDGHNENDSGSFFKPSSRRSYGSQLNT